MIYYTEKQVFPKIKKSGWYEKRGKWHNNYKPENCQGLSLEEVLMIQNLK